LEKLGYGFYGGMGDKMPLNYLEIDAYMRATRTNLTSWEVDMIKQLSHDYIVQSQKKGMDEFPPFMEVDEFTYLSNLRS
jgi:hypothetical protein